MAYDVAESAVVLLASAGINPITSNTSTWTYANGTWAPVVTAINPPDCGGSVMAYDAADSETVLFTGANCTGSDQTWIFQADSWLHLHPSMVPPARDGAILTYDPSRDYAVLAGGYNSSCGGFCSDTWDFSGGNWTNLTGQVAGALPGREGAAAAYNPSDGDVFVFGGGGSSGSLNDTWAFNGTAWSQVPLGGSEPEMFAPLLTYDSADGYLLLADGDSTGCVEVCPNQTWSVVSGAWTKITPTGPLPPPSGDWSWTYDSAAAAVVLFGGPFAYSVYPITGSTWTYVGGGWLNRSLSQPPPPRSEASLVYDAADGYVLLFGGWTVPSGGNSYFIGDTWSYSNGVWTNLTGSQTTAPGARSGAAIAYDAADGYVILFGGESPSCHGGTNPSFPVCGDTWEFIGGKWTRLTPSIAPSNRSNAGMVYDVADGEVVLFGGTNELGLNDTWTFSAGVWTNITTWSPHPPPTSPIASAGLTYDAGDGYLLLFGAGLSQAPWINNDTWAFHAGLWTNLTASVRGAPSPEVGGTLAYDPTYGVSVEFGGCLTDDCSVLGGQTFTYVNSNWTARFPPQEPSPRDGSQMVFDSADGILLLFGGEVVLGDSRGVTGDLWEFGMVSTTLSVQKFTSSPDVSDVGLPITLHVSTANGNGTLSYSYIDLPHGCLTSNASSLTCTPATAGTYSVGVVVTDTADQQASAQLTLTVNMVPSITTFQASPNTTNVGNRTLLEAVVTGGTGSYSYQYTGLPPGCLSQTVPTLPCQPNTAGNYTVSVNVTDSVGGKAMASLGLTVEPASVGTYPQVSRFAASPSPISLGNETNFSVDVVGGNTGMTFEYSGLPPGCTSANVTTLPCTPTSADTYTIQLDVVAPNGNSTEVGTTLTVYPAGTPGHPLVEAFAATPSLLQLGNSTVFDVTATEGASVLTFSFGGLPPGCQSRDQSALPCTPTSGGAYTVTVVVRDTRGNATSVATSITVTGRGIVPGSGTNLSVLYTEYAIVAIGIAVGSLGAAGVLLQRRDRRLRDEGEQWIGGLLTETRSPPKKPGP
ncbi:MAG: kelch repeat-containing protein [Thermoplasmata archaeon]